MIHRRQTRTIRVGTVAIGGGAPVSIQTMTNTDTANVAATLAQIRSVASLGAEIVRVAVPDLTAATALGELVRQSPVPLIADIHFDADLAVASLRQGAAAVRVNPGNLHDLGKVAEVARCAAELGRAVRIGVNGGSLAPEIRRKYGGHPCAEAMVESALHYCQFFEEHGCSQLKVSLKASDVATTVEACRQFAALTDYPLHIGVTEAGTATMGVIKSAAGLGALLLSGIGDTLRVSLTAPPEDEVVAGIRILEAVGLRQSQPEIVSCPTCGRTRIDLVPLVEAVEAEIRRIKQSGKTVALRKIALMGCVVNGPGEAREADLGIAGGQGEGVLFKNGEIVRKLREDELLPTLLAEIHAAIRDVP